jgi:hypothetical protein
LETIVESIARIESPVAVPSVLAQLNQLLPTGGAAATALGHGDLAPTSPPAEKTESHKPQPATPLRQPWKQPHLWAPAALIVVLLAVIVVLWNRNGTKSALRNPPNAEPASSEPLTAGRSAAKGEISRQSSFHDPSGEEPLGGIPDSLIDAPAEPKKTTTRTRPSDSTVTAPAADAPDENGGQPEAQEISAKPGAALDSEAPAEEPAPPADQETAAADASSAKESEQSAPKGSAAEGKASSPFAKTPAAVGLPPVADLSSVALGEVDPGPQYLLACALVVDQALTRRTNFGLEKGADDQEQRWSVVARPVSGQALTVGELSLVDGWLRFQWLADAARDATVPFLQNCLLKLEAHGETFFVRLRAPASLGVAKVSAENPQSTLAFDLEYFPTESAAIEFEFLKVTDTKFAEEDQEFSFISDPDDRLVPPRGSLYLLFSEKAERFLFVEINAKAGKRSEVSATLRVYQEPKPRPYSEKLVAELDQLLQANANRIGMTYQQAQAYEAPDGSKRDHAKVVKQLAAELEVAQQHVAELAVQMRRAAVLFDKPIRFRAFYRLADVEVDVATWDGKVHSAK